MLICLCQDIYNLVTCLRNDTVTMDQFFPFLTLAFALLPCFNCCEYFNCFYYGCKNDKQIFPWELIKYDLILISHLKSLILSPRHPSPGSLSHSECSSPSLITPPQSPLNLETSSFASSQSQSSISTLPRISVSPVPIGERRKDR